MIQVDRYAHSLQPSVRFGVAFGSDLLIISITGQDHRGCRTLEFPGWSQELPGTGTGGPVEAIPVLIHYDDDGTPVIGSEVIHAGCLEHPATARWIRKYLLEESPVRIPSGTDRRITFRDAATDFLGTVLARAAHECPGIPSVVFAIPADAPEWYAGWLGSIAHSTGIASWHTLDEHVAVTAGYGLSVEEDQALIIICFDETDLTVSVVLSEGSSDQSPDWGLRVAGQARDDTGCRALDSWIAQDIPARNRIKCTAVRAQRIYDRIIERIGEVYNQLAVSEEAVLEIEDLPGTTIPARFTREDISRIMAEHGFPAVLSRTIDRAMAAARSRGCGEKPPVTVLMTGRGSAIPAVQELMKMQFSGIPVLCDHPFDAIARGAALFIPRASMPDRIRNHYALRYWDPDAREHRYRFLVRGGARYPSAGQVARITISAAYDGQVRLGIPLYEISTAPDGHVPALELLPDPAGGIRLAGPAEDAGSESRPHPVNERIPTLLVADPPALKGEPRFELTFLLDREKQLCVTARDLVTGILVKKDTPVYRLT